MHTPWFAWLGLAIWLLLDYLSFRPLVKALNDMRLQHKAGATIDERGRGLGFRMDKRNMNVELYEKLKAESIEGD